MRKRTFKKDFLVDELELPWDDNIIRRNEIIDTSRWSTIYELVFEHEGKHYLTTYSVGATESQDERPWEYENEVECVEVELVPVTVKKWIPVE